MPGTPHFNSGGIMEKRFYGSFLVSFFVALLLVSLLLISQGCAKRGTSIRAKLEKTSDDGRFIDHGDGAITDTNTGLMWTQKDSFADLGKCLDFNASRSYVSRLSTGGYNDWRMPTVQELKMIYEENKKHEMGFEIRDWRSKFPLGLDPVFADGAAFWYWSSEERRSCCARFFAFGHGKAFARPQNYCRDNGVRAVRP